MEGLGLEATLSLARKAPVGFLRDEALYLWVKFLDRLESLGDSIL